VSRRPGTGYAGYADRELKEAPQFCIRLVRARKATVSAGVAFGDLTATTGERVKGRPHASAVPSEPSLGRAAGRAALPAARARTSVVVSALPPIAQSPLSNSFWQNDIGLAG